MLLVGLGNPGEKYSKTRHNVGFLLCDALMESYGGGTFSSKFQGLLGKITIDGQSHFILKPQTFMNESGRSVQAACQFYKIPPEEVVVFYDELDIVTGKVKLKQGGGSAGHNGIKSIASAIGQNFWRVRMGIDHPGLKDAVASYVLKPFSKTQQPLVEDMIARVVKDVPHFLKGNVEHFMGEINNLQNAQNTKQGNKNTKTSPEIMATKETQKPAGIMGAFPLNLLSRHKEKS